MKLKELKKTLALFTAAAVLAPGFSGASEVFAQELENGLYGEENRDQEGQEMAGEQTEIPETGASEIEEPGAEELPQETEEPGDAGSGEDSQASEDSSQGAENAQTTEPGAAGGNEVPGSSGETGDASGENGTGTGSENGETSGEGSQENGDGTSGENGGSVPSDPAGEAGTGSDDGAGDFAGAGEQNPGDGSGDGSAPSGENGLGGDPEAGVSGTGENGQEAPQEQKGETPEEYQARTGYILPEGYTFALDGSGYVVLLEDGSPALTEVEEESFESNEELIAHQQIVELPVMVEDFRFWTTARKYAFAKDKLYIKEEMSQDSRKIGELSRRGLCYILKEEGDWYYVESGRVRGFVEKSSLNTGEKAQKLLERYQRKAKRQAELENREYAGIDGAAPMAKELVSWRENQAFLYLRATVGQTVVEKKPALSKADLLNIREDKNTESRIVGTLARDGLCYILADEGSEWVYVESGDVRGFVKSEFLTTGEEASKLVAEKGGDAFGLAEELVEPKENQACYYTMTSIQSGVPGGTLRSSIVEFAAQFIGNPYVWGGTSLTEGADCSGFVQSIYREYGHELPRTAEEQALCGTQIPVEDALPGDLIFYARDGQVFHVVMYAGDGKTVEAKGRDYGIVQDTVNTGCAVWAVRLLEDTVSVEPGDIGEVNASPEAYGEDLGEFKLTYYCSCELCCDVETGITATGTPVIEGQTIAVDPNVIPYGTQVIIGGHIFTAEDCGGAIKGNRIDIYVDSHEKANALGVGYADVYLLK